MVLFDYYDSIGDAIEYLMALGSVLGMLGLIFGFFLMVMGSKKSKGAAFGIIIFSFIVVSICGLETGIKYFRL